MAGEKPTFSSVLSANTDTFSFLGAFSAAMFAGALATYYTVSSEAVGSLFAETRAGRDVVGAIAAIVVTNLFIAAYVVRAFNEPEDETAPVAAAGAKKSKKGD